MKKSRIAKMALLGASTLALAGTLSTSTYAWYVSNKTADLTGLTAGTGAAGADDSLSIAFDNTSSTKWKTSLTLASSNLTAKADVSLSPVLWAPTTRTFTKLNGDSVVAATDKSVIEFTIYIKSESTTGVNVKPTITLKNVTNTNGTSLPTQQAYESKTNGSPVAEGEEFSVNIFEALYVGQYDGTTTSVEAPSTGTSGKAQITQYGDASTEGTKNAHTYYEKVSGSTLSEANKTGVTAEGLANLTVTSTPLAVTYYIWLAGNDSDCFNSCAGQSIYFDVKFDVVTA